ncbi:MAG: hypothetical protein R3B13_15870 [Polyangiaceae bacterium]
MTTFLECGWAAWVVVLVAVVGVAAGLTGLGLALFRPKWGLGVGVLALGIALTIPATGVIGTTLGRSKVDEVLTSGAIDPAMKERIRAVGYAEAKSCTTLGLTFGALPGLLSVIAVGLAFVRRGTRPESP